MHERDRRLRALPARLLGWLAVLAAATFVAARIYDAVAEQEGVAGLDRPVLDVMLAHRSPGAVTWATRYTALGGPVWFPVVLLGLAAVLSWLRRSWVPAVLLAVAGTGALVITVVGKYAVGRLRPPVTAMVPPPETTPAFPSGHSLNSAVAAGMVIYLLWHSTGEGRYRRAGRAALVVLAGAAAVLMGLTRVYLGYHWLTDVLVAWALAVGWVAVVAAGHRWWLTGRPNPAMPSS